MSFKTWQWQNEVERNNLNDSKDKGSKPNGGIMLLTWDSVPFDSNPFFQSFKSSQDFPCHLAIHNIINLFMFMFLESSFIKTI